MPEELKVTWQPRTWLQARSVVTTDNDPAMTFYTGASWLLGLNTLVEMSPRKQKPFPNLPANHEIYWMWKSTANSYLVMSKTAAAATFSLVYLTTSSYTAITFAPTGNLGIALKKPHLVLQGLTVSNTYYFTRVSHGLCKIVGTNCTQVTGATTLLTVLQHLSRLLGISSDNNQARIQYSVPGDWDDWTTTTDGAGSIDLLLNNEVLVDIKVVDNVLVILGNRSIFIGYPTGVTSPPYRIEQILSHSDVVQDSRTVCQYDNTLYYRGATSIYRYEKFQQTDIGSDQLLNMLRTSTSANFMSGVITYNMRETDVSLPGERFVENVHYVLLPVTLFQITTQVPIAYNIKKGIWESFCNTQHIDLSDLLTKNNGFFEIVTPMMSDHSLNNPMEIVHWRRDRVEYFTNGTDLTASLVVTIGCPLFAVGDVSRNYRLERIMFKYSLTTGDLTPPQVKVYNFDIRCMRNTNEEVTNFLPVSLYTVFNNTRPRTQWINLAHLDVTGQFFTLDISFNQDPTYRLEFHEMSFYFTDAGESLGVESA